MVNASTPAGYIPLQVPQLDVEPEELVTQSGYISSRANKLYTNQAEIKADSV